MYKTILFLVFLQLSLISNENMNFSSNLLHDGVRSNDLKSVKCLLDQNIDINQKDEFGNTPLHLAVRANNYEMVELLLDYNAKVNTKNDFGDTPIIDAARNNDLKISRELICSGAIYNITDSDGESPLQYSVENKNIELSKLFIISPKEQDCNIKIAFSNINNIKDHKICGKVLRGKFDRIVFFILDTKNKTLLELGNANISKNGKSWCAKSNVIDSIKGSYEVIVNGYSENKKTKISKVFN